MLCAAARAAKRPEDHGGDPLSLALSTSAARRAQEGCRVEARLLLEVAELGADGAGAPRETTALPAGRAGSAFHVTHAGIEVIHTAAKCLHRTSGQAGLGAAALARTRRVLERRQLQPPLEHQRSSICVPRSPFGMDQDADGTRMDGLAAPAEALERQQRRAARIDVQCAELA